MENRGTMHRQEEEKMKLNKGWKTKKLIGDQNSMSFKEKDLLNKRQREQWALSKDYRNKCRRELRLKKSDNQHTDNYTRYRQQLNSGRSEGIICYHNEVGNLLDTNTSEVLDNIETNIVGTGHSTMPTSYKHTQPLQPHVQVGKSARKIREEELKQYYGSESEKPLIIGYQGSDLRCFAKRKLKERSDQYAVIGLVRTQESKEKIN
ncbi:Uncharacterized protein Fot_25194 [Forsythia ovata]|uniref:Uncharacterized protein n=1 Tax=Forsythia ovata TaxID=205694 RepID=A0ABD1U8F1_9LAMI